ncbi:MAG: ribonuclease III [Candidatus Delongbacteria bacterium]|nr:ribonuclease III [Candidatus Delongbacteria bacterium]
MLKKFFAKNEEDSVDTSVFDNLKTLEDKILYSFKNKDLLLTALKHRSFISQTIQERIDSNERLEFLGDSVLNFIVVKHLYKTYPDLDEGELSKMKSVIVSGENLSLIAREMNLGEHILLSEYEERAGGRDKSSILEDTFEAIIGAVYLDSGILKSEKIIKVLVLEDIKKALENTLTRNYKSELLELVQSNGLEPPTYEVISEEGPEHEKVFTVKAIVDGKEVSQGSSTSKKRAEQEASRKALENLDLLSN